MEKERERATEREREREKKELLVNGTIQQLRCSETLIGLYSQYSPSLLSIVSILSNFPWYRVETRWKADLWWDLLFHLHQTQLWYYLNEAFEDIINYLYILSSPKYA